MKQGLSGLATGIGSLPHKDAEQALNLVFKYAPHLPFWPQLPKRDIREGMTAQFSEGLPCIRVTDKGVTFSSAEREKELERFYGKIINRDIDYFKISPDFAEGLYAFKQRLGKEDPSRIRGIKCHVTGPFTFAAGINDENGRALLYDPEMMQAVTEGLLMKALWQIKSFEEFGQDMIIYIDEPYLGCFGSAYTPLNREDAVGVLSEFTKRIKEAGRVLTGVHCCGNTDWSIFTDIESLDIINFDAFGFLDKLLLYADNLRGFFDSGRMLCWGIVPTFDFSVKITAEELIKKIDGGIDVLSKKGVNRDKLYSGLLLSPACGLGTLDIETSGRIFKVLSEVSEKVKK